MIDSTEIADALDGQLLVTEERHDSWRGVRRGKFADEVLLGHRFRLDQETNLTPLSGHELCLIGSLSFEG